MFDDIEVTAFRSQLEWGDAFLVLSVTVGIVIIYEKLNNVTVAILTGIVKDTATILIRDMRIAVRSSSQKLDKFDISVFRRQLERCYASLVSLHWVRVVFLHEKTSNLKVSILTGIMKRDSLVFITVVKVSCVETRQVFHYIKVPSLH